MKAKKVETPVKSKTSNHNYLWEVVSGGILLHDYNVQKTSQTEPIDENKFYRVAYTSSGNVEVIEPLKEGFYIGLESDCLEKNKKFKKEMEIISEKSFVFTWDEDYLNVWLYDVNFKKLKEKLQSVLKQLEVVLGGPLKEGSEYLITDRIFVDDEGNAFDMTGYDE